jgi:hypothetical protein
MGSTVDMLEHKFNKICNNGSLILDEDFMMNIFSEIIEEVKPFKKYLKFMFNEKVSNPIRSKAKDEKVKPYQRPCEELFYPTWKDICQKNELARKMAVEAATVFLIEFRDPTKVTSQYLSSISGSKSWGCQSSEMKALSLHVSASNSVSEAYHKLPTVGLKLSGTVHLDHICAEGQTRHNNDFGHGHKALVQGK